MSNWRQQFQVVENQKVGQLLEAKREEKFRSRKVSKLFPDVKCARTINQSMLLAYEDVPAREYSGIFSCQELFLSSKSQKIQHLLSFTSAVRIYFKHATDGLDRGEVWNPAIFRQSLQMRKFFSKHFFSEKFFRSKALHFSSSTFFCGKTTTKKLQKHPKAQCWIMRGKKHDQLPYPPPHRHRHRTEWFEPRDVWTKNLFHRLQVLIHVESATGCLDNVGHGNALRNFGQRQRAALFIDGEHALLRDDHVHTCLPGQREIAVVQNLRLILLRRVLHHDHDLEEQKWKRKIKWRKKMAKGIFSHCVEDFVKDFRRGRKNQPVTPWCLPRWLRPGPSRHPFP